MDQTAAPINLHASAVVVAQRGLLITGPSGSGKSSMALALMALGADLVADDRTDLTREGAGVRLSCPPAIAGMVEAWGLGILAAKPSQPAPLYAVLDMGTRAADRLPETRETVMLGQAFPLVHHVDAPHFPSAMMQFLRCGRTA